MKVISQVQLYNRQVAKQIIRREDKRTRINPAIEEAAYVAGNAIAAMNNNESGNNTRMLDDIVKSIKPKYLQKRGVV